MIDKKLIDQKNWEEHYVKKGDPSKQTYYIIRRKLPWTGLFSNFVVFASHIGYALSKSWLPVIDMQNYPNSMLEPKKLGKENAWEYFFEQPLRIGLEEAYAGENVVLCKEANYGFPWTGMELYTDKEVRDFWRTPVEQELLKVKPEIMAEVDAIRAKLFAPTDKVLGVYLRGTDYFSLKLLNHPIPPPVEYARDVILQKLVEWKCNKIFLSTEDKNIVQFFKDTFGDGFGTFCVTIDREYPTYKPGQVIAAARSKRPNDRYLNAKEYLTEMLILSKCNSFVTARCSGSNAVMMLSEGFENVYAFNLGNYGVVPINWRELIGQ